MMADIALWILAGTSTVTAAMAVTFVVWLHRKEK